jgi:hypothetical protein
MKTNLKKYNFTWIVVVLLLVSLACGSSNETRVIPQPFRS